jgi:AcrR family transcriptional regulator
MEGVATRAGVGKATVYRRWPSKSALVVDGIRAFCREHGAQPAPDTGNVHDDLLLCVRGVVSTYQRSEAGRVLPGLVNELHRNPELAEAFRGGFLEERRAVVREIVRRGIDRGELRADLDLDLVLDAIAAFVHYRLLITAMPIDHDLPERVVDLLWRGAAAGR